MKPTILLAEDDEDVRNALHALLLREGYEVVEASNGTDAVNLAREYRPDAVLMDLVLPGINGLDAARFLKHEPATADVPIIGLTAAVWLLREGESPGGAGFDAVFPKPFQLDAMFGELRRLVAPAVAPG